MRRASSLLPVLLLSLVCTWADDKQDEDSLKKQFVGNIVTLRGFYKGDLLQYDSDGQPRFNPVAGPWTLYGKVSPNDVKLKSDKLEIDGNRLLVAWRQDSGGTGHMKYIKADRLLIEVKLDDQHRDEASIQHLLARVFTNPSDSLSELVPEHWRRFLASGAKNIETVDAYPQVAKDRFVVPPVSSPASGDPNRPLRVRVSQGVNEGNIVKKVRPEYPALAKAAKLQGQLMFRVIISKEGTMGHISVASPLGLGLEESAMEAVSQWRYRPYILNGEPVEVETLITVKYTLRQ